MTTTIPDNWYETFFRGINCEMWEKAITPEWTNAEVAFVQDMMNLPAGASILDMPCGTGRHSVMLARKGFKLTSVDISDEFISGLKKLVESERLPVNVMHANSLSVQLNSMYDGAFCLGNCFGYFGHEGMLAFIQKVAAALKTGARWIIHSGLMAESFLTKFIKAKTHELPGLTMHINNDYDEWNSCLLTTLTYTKAGKEEVHRFKHHVYTIAEVIRLLNSYHLKTIALYSSSDKETFYLGDAQVYLVAEKY